ncbi:MAG: hypothetical protein PHI05_03570 [Bacilli bacterium]|nr:hypothetical protein [Bacilli bacterium]MDD4547800.1 hypothetical protein [Bacilli bacterium]
MTDKELLKRLKELLETVPKHNEENEATKEDSTSNSYGKTKSLGAYPGTEHFFKKPVVEEKDYQKGYSSVLLLGFLTFFFQVLFMLIGYIIFK